MTRTLAPNGIPARIVLAALESAGILYANLSPLIVSALARTEAFTAATSGYVFAANMYGTAIGGFAILFIVRRLRWRPVSAALLLLLMLLDLSSAVAREPFLLYLLRFAHGLVGGVLIGVVMSVIARTLNPERTIALFIMLQLMLGGVLTVVLTPVLDTAGPSVVWLSLLVLSVPAVLLLPLLDDYPIDDAATEMRRLEGRAPLFYIGLAMLGLFVYQSGEMAAFAFVIELGASYAFEPGFISTAVAASLWIGGPAALVVTWWSTQSGRLLPVVISTLLMALAVSLLLVPAQLAFVLANVGFGVFFSISFPYLMGVASEMDNSGQMGAVAGFAGNLGLATGPALAGMLAADGQFRLVVVFAVLAILVGLALAVRPARILDQRNLTGKVIW